jgi:protein-disulfide isomerase
MTRRLSFGAILALTGLLGACTESLTKDQLDAGIDAWIQAHPERLQASMMQAQARQAQAQTQAIAAKAGRAINAALLPADAPRIGPADAKHTIVYFYAPACPACRATTPMLTQFMRQHPDTALVLRPIPIIHPEEDTAMASWELAAARMAPKDLLSLHDEMMRASVDGKPAPLPNTTALAVLAIKAGLNSGTVQKGASDPAIQSTLKANVDYARQIGISSTPTYWVDGQIFIGGMDERGLETAIKVKSGGIG